MNMRLMRGEPRLPNEPEFSAHAIGENGVHVHVWHCVWYSGYPFAETLVDGPHFKPFGYFLVARRERIAP